MSGLNHPVFYAAFMLVAGLGIPIFAALNGDLGSRLNSPVLAAMIALFVGTLACAGFMFLSGNTPDLTSKAPIPFYSYFGGLLIVFYVLGVTWIAPKFGVGNAVAFVLLGQLVSMSIIDHYGLFRAVYHPMSGQRFAGLVLMAIGVFLSVRR